MSQACTRTPARRVWLWTRDLLSDSRYALRQLRLAPSFTITALVILALGTGVALAVLHLANAAMFYALAIPDARLLIRLSDGPDGPAASLPYALAQRYRDRRDLFTYVITENRLFKVALDDEPESVHAAFVSSTYFQDLQAPAALGRLLDERDIEADDAIVLSHRVWSRRFASDPAAIGRVIRVNGTPREIVGVVAANFDGLADPGTPPVAVWLPAPARPLIVGSGSEANLPAPLTTAVYGRLRPGVARTAVRDQVRLLAREWTGSGPPDVPSADALDVGPVIRDPRFEGDVAALFALFALVFCSACANLGNMMLARGVQRRHELRMRLALGADTGRILRQLLSESLVLAIIGCGLGTAAGYLGAQLLMRYWTDLPLGLHVEFDMRMALASVTTVVIAVLAFGVVPAWQIARSRMRIRGRRAFVAAQVATGCVLLIVATMLTRSSDRLNRVEPQFDYTRILLLDPQLSARTWARDDQRALLDDMTIRVAQVPGVDGVSIAAMGGTFVGTPLLLRREVTADFFRTIALPIVRGRPFVPGETRVMVISESAARAGWPGEDPLGQTWEAGRLGPHVIVGVAKDDGLGVRRDRGVGEAYVPLVADRLAAATLVVHTSTDPRPLLVPVRTAAAGSGLTPAVTEMSATMTPVSNAASLIGVLGALATTLAFVGILGLVTFTVSQETRQIGIRLALGARPSLVVMALLRSQLVPVGSGLAAGILTAAALAQLLRRQLHGVGPLDPVSYLSTVGVLGAVALVAIVLPARRAARLDLWATLRCE